MANPNPYDPLLEALLIIAKLKGCPTSRQSLLSSLPYKGEPFGSKLLIRAADKIGLQVFFRTRKFNELTEELFPLILLIEDNDTLVITEKTASGQYTVINPKTSEKEIINADELASLYNGYCFLIKTQPDADQVATMLGATTQPTHWFWHVFFKFRHNYNLILFASFFINLFAIAMPLFIMNVYDRVIPNNAKETLWVLTVGISIIITFDFILKTLRVYFVDLCGEKVDVIVSQKIFQHMLGLVMASKDSSTGMAAHRISQFENIISFITSSTIITLIDIPFILLFLFIIYLVGGIMVVLPIAAIPLMLLLAYLVSLPLRRAVSESYQNNALKQDVLIEAIKNFDTIKSFNAQGVLAGRWDRFAARAAKSSVKSRGLQFAVGNIVATLQLIVTVLVIVMGVYQVSEGNLSMGALIACTILTSRALAPLAGIINLKLRYELAKVSLQALSKLMGLPMESPHGKRKVSREDISPCIEFSNITFSYPDASLPIFDRLSLRINEGEKVGIIGPMGSGKSTLLKLIMGFYPPEEGAILLGGIDIQQIDVADLRGNISYASQNTSLLRGTIRDNIVLSMPWADEQQIIQSAQLVGADQFIDRNPQGYDLLVEEDGNNLSHGQKQAIGLARTFLAESNLLLLDEPTAAMDTASETRFIQHMHDYISNKTLVLVTHRMTLLPLVERLVIVKDGKIIADGPKDSVLQALSNAAEGEKS